VDRQEGHCEAGTAVQFVHVDDARGSERRENAMDIFRVWKTLIRIVCV